MDDNTKECIFCAPGNHRIDNYFTELDHTGQWWISYEFCEDSLPIKHCPECERDLRSGDEN